MWRFREILGSRCGVLQAGSYCDAQDEYGKWFESIVRERTADGKLRVHFMGWSPKWDLYMYCSSVKVQPHHSKVPNWRIFRANDRFDMKVGDKWHVGSVEKVDRVDKRVLLRPTVASTRKEVGQVWYEFMRYAQAVLGAGFNLLSVGSHPSVYAAVMLAHAQR